MKLYTNSARICSLNSHAQQHSPLKLEGFLLSGTVKAWWAHTLLFAAINMSTVSGLIQDSNKTQKTLVHPAFGRETFNCPFTLLALDGLRHGMCWSKQRTSCAPPRCPGQGSQWGRPSVNHVGSLAALHGSGSYCESLSFFCSGWISAPPHKSDLRPAITSAWLVARCSNWASSRRPTDNYNSVQTTLSLASLVL